MGDKTIGEKEYDPIRTINVSDQPDQDYGFSCYLEII